MPQIYYVSNCSRWGRDIVTFFQFLSLPLPHIKTKQKNKLKTIVLSHLQIFNLLQDSTKPKLIMLYTEKHNWDTTVKYKFATWIKHLYYSSLNSACNKRLIFAILAAD